MIAVAALLVSPAIEFKRDTYRRRVWTAGVSAAPRKQVSRYVLYAMTGVVEEQLIVTVRFREELFHHGFNFRLCRVNETCDVCWVVEAPLRIGQRSATSIDIVSRAKQGVEVAIVGVCSAYRSVELGTCRSRWSARSPP